MPGAVRPLRKLQLGKETTKGTGVAATARLIGEIEYEDDATKIMPERDYGVLAGGVEVGDIVRELSKVTVETELSYQQILYPLLAGVRGAVTPTGAGADKTWVFTPLASATPNPDAFTLQYVENDGTADVQTLRSVYGLVGSLGFHASQAAEYATMKMEWFARGPTVTAPTAGIAIPTRTIVPGPKFTVALATSFAGLPGAGPIAAEVVSFDWEIVTGLAPRWRLDTASPSMSAHQFGRRSGTLKIAIDLSATSEAERVNYFRTTARRFCRLKVLGPTLGASNFSIIIDSSLGLIDFGPPSDQEEQSVVELSYNLLYDPTSAKDFEITVVNELTAAP
jgi:hypothetical protein